MARKSKAVVYYLSRGSNLRSVRRVVKEFLDAEEFIAKAEFVEHGQGTGRQDWPELRKAIDAAVSKKARLVIAKLGRLVRNPSFLRLLQSAGVPFVCCDCPNLDEGNVHRWAARAQGRAQQMSRDTRDACTRGFITSDLRRSDPRFKQGVKKGGRNSGKIRKARTAALYAILIPKMQELRAAGETYDQVADSLNDSGHMTTIGTPFNGPTVYRILHR